MFPAANPSRPIKRSYANTPLNVLYIASSQTSLDSAPFLQTRQEASGGILPTDTYQDVPIDSIETPHDVSNAGAQQYCKFLLNHSEYPSIEASFEQYRTARRDPNTYVGHLDTDAHRKPTSGPNDDGIDFSDVPRHKQCSEYDYPVYKAITSKSLVALAIIRLAEKNLPFVNFDSALTHLPNLGPIEPYPRWREDMSFIDTDILQGPEPTNGWIRVVFLPGYYSDGRHAIGFYTRKQPSMRFAAMVFTPCTVADLKAAKLWHLVYDNGVEPDAAEDDKFAWEDTLVGAWEGEWFHPDVVEEFETWRAVLMAELDWRIRMHLTQKVIEEDSREAPYRDKGRVWDNETE